MIDRFGRDIHYLRVSVTDRCNLRCRYCMPESGVTHIEHSEVLRYDEITRLVRIMAGLGVNRVRLTGGEPLVRNGLPKLAAAIKGINGIDFLGLTTNGVLLSGMAEALCRAGVDGLNISLDTLDAQRYAHITRRGKLSDALDGLQAALAQPFSSVKINCVLAPQSTPQDWLAVAGLAKNHAVDVRLIEWMPMAGEENSGGVRRDEALAAIALQYGPLHPVQNTLGGGPARYWSIAGFRGRIGVIHAMSHRFCAECNRLRLTSAGDLKMCLFYDVGVPLKPLLRGGAHDDAIAGAIVDALQHKPRNHEGAVKGTEEGGACSIIDHPHGMYNTGG